MGTGKLSQGWCFLHQVISVARSRDTLKNLIKLCWLHFPFNEVVNKCLSSALWSIAGCLAVFVEQSREPYCPVSLALSSSSTFNHKTWVKGNIRKKSNNLHKSLKYKHSISQYKWIILQGKKTFYSVDTHDNTLLLSYFFRFDKSSTDIKLLVSMLVILDFVKTYVVCFQKIIFFMNTLYDFFPF